MDRRPGESRTTYLPHRDPETGQFLSDDHEGAYAEADDILYLRGDQEVDDTDSGTDTFPDMAQITFQRDYRILGLEARYFGRWSAFGGGASVEDPPSEPIEYTFRSQFATTADYAEPETHVIDGGLEPSGVYDHHELTVVPPTVWDDDTNGGAASTAGLAAESRHFLPAEEMVNVDVTPNAGNTVSIHGMLVGGSNQGAAKFLAEGRFLLAERAEG